MVESRTMNNEQAVHVSATCDSNFVRILDCYKSMKIKNQIQYFVLLLIIMVPFSYGIGFLGLFLTITVCVVTVVYLLVQQVHILYQNCLKSISEQTADLDQD